MISRRVDRMAPALFMEQFFMIRFTKIDKKSRMIYAPCFISTMVQWSILKYQDLLDLIALANLINHLHSFIHFAEAGVVTVQVGGVVAAVADEKLGASCVAAGMCHRQYASIVVLVVAIQLTLDGVTRPPGTCAVGASALDHKVRDHAMECQSVVKPTLGQFHEIGHRLGGILLVKLHFHHSFSGVYLSYEHISSFLV